MKQERPIIYGLVLIAALKKFAKKRSPKIVSTSVPLIYYVLFRPLLDCPKGHFPEPDVEGQRTFVWPTKVFTRKLHLETRNSLKSLCTSKLTTSHTGGLPPPKPPPRATPPSLFPSPLFPFKELHKHLLMMGGGSI